ncbi:tail assembly protein, partial [Acinetobacter baumannii]|nr:tail assembly protein [Acinetobacter baumannii]
FNGTEQTEVQGGPIQLIYGRCLVQGTPISVAMSIDQLLFEGE